MPEKTAWHSIDIATAAGQLGANLKSGLSSAESADRLERFGRNVLAEPDPKRPLRIFLNQFKDIMILLLFVAAVVSAAVGEVTDTLAIVVILLLNGVIGFYQEWNAEKAVRSLRELASPDAVVIRDGETKKIKAELVVPGDLVVLEAGQLVPADIRLVEAAGLKAIEASLTGESVPVEKDHRAILAGSLPLGDMVNMALKSTKLSSGRGKGIVVATGMDTEIGRIAALVQQREVEKTPLQKRLAVFGTRLSFIVLVISAVIFVSGLMRGESVLLMLMMSVSIAVAAIPEALPALVTISLAMGASRMVKKNVLIRNLSAVETLGSVTYICTDKTGTLTQNRMTVTDLFTASGRYKVDASSGSGDLTKLIEAMALNNDATFNNAGEAIGDPTETAMLSAAHGFGVDRTGIEKRYPRVGEIPFDSERKMMSTVHADPGGGYIMITKGAAEAVLGITGKVDSDGTVTAGIDALRNVSDNASADGLRVIAFAHKKLDVLPLDLWAEEKVGFTFLGMAGLQDPPREEAARAVSDCASAGIHTVMITGDHPATASKIARDLGIDGGPGEIVTGPELASMPPGELEGKVESIRVYSRVAPEQKYNIVQALKAKGHYVAMTGDGVNDAPALKKSDIGVAMGIMGTDVAREASDMVLLDDNFASIANAVREGRRIYDNIRKFTRYMMASNSGEIWTIFLAPLVGLPLPLVPVQILWINLITDGLPGLTLATEPEEKNIMRRPPRPPDENIFAHGLGFHVIWVGLLMGSLCIGVQAWALKHGMHWQSMVFTVLCFSQMAHVMAIRSERESLFTQGFLTNKPLLLAVILTIALQLCTLYVPFLNPVFRTAPLSVLELSVAFAVSSIIFVAVEIEKGILRSFHGRSGKP
jgi:Ca2+-transporting ATPase